MVVELKIITGLYFLTAMNLYYALKQLNYLEVFFFFHIHLYII